MLYLKASQNNTIAVTWTERSTSATVYRLRLTNLATLDATDYFINAGDNLSSYESRYDKFTFALGALEKGQYRYEVTENPASYAAGDFVQGGLFTYEYEGYAYITAEFDQDDDAPWGCKGVNIVGTDPEDGINNTALIVAGCATAGIAARLANDLELNGFTDWFLPADGQLLEMYNYLASEGLGNFANHTYWSSTQFSANLAYMINMSDGTTQTHNKDNTSNRYTRAMRRFVLPTTAPRVIETGLAMIETTEQTYSKTTNTIDYVSYNS